MSRRYVCRILMLLATLVAVPAICAAEHPFDEVRVCFVGHLKVGHWTPLSLVIEGPAEGRFSVLVPDGQGGPLDAPLRFHPNYSRILDRLGLIELLPGFTGRKAGGYVPELPLSAEEQDPCFQWGDWWMQIGGFQVITYVYIVVYRFPGWESLGLGHVWDSLSAF